MRAILLCAGFATRLFPLTRDRAKPLLPVAGRPILEHLLDPLLELGRIDETVIVTNARFHSEFDRWLSLYRRRRPRHRFRLLNDGATDNEHRLGAVRDLALAVAEVGRETPTLVAAADNLFRFSLKRFFEDFAAHPRSLVLRYREPDRDRLRRTGVVKVDEEDSGRILEFREKPEEPESTWACPAFYLFEPEALALPDRFLSEAPETDAPGHFIAWLSRHLPVYTHLMRGVRLDVGDLESYRRAEAWLREPVPKDDDLH